MGGGPCWQVVFVQPCLKKLRQFRAVVLQYPQGCADIRFGAQAGELAAEIAGRAAAVGIKRQHDLAGQIVFYEPGIEGRRDVPAPVGGTGKITEYSLALAAPISRRG